MFWTCWFFGLRERCQPVKVNPYNLIIWGAPPNQKLFRQSSGVERKK